MCEHIFDSMDAEEKRERHNMVMGMTFISEEAAYVFYNNHAKEHGFGVRKGKVRRGKGPLNLGEITIRTFFCHREGYRNKKFLTMEGRKRRLRAETRCGCPAHLTVKYEKNLGAWAVSSFDDGHNHVRARPDEVSFLWSHRKMKDSQRAEILSMVSCGLRKHQVMRTFIARYGHYGDVGFVRRDVYNMCCREKRKLIAKGDAATAIGILNARRKKDPDFFFEYKLDKKGRLKNLLWCDSQSRRDYQDYGDVVVFDSTYKMNKYSMPFIPFVGINNHRKTTVFACAVVSNERKSTYKWLLKTFLRAMCQKKPKGIITDGDAATRKAIRDVFTGVWHRVCSWHIEKNMKIHLGSKTWNEFRSLLYYTTTEEIFEQRWNAFVTKWRTERTAD